MFSDQNLRDLKTIWAYMNLTHDLPDTADAIIIGGEGILTDAATRAAEIYQQGIAPLIITSGYSSPSLGGATTEARHLADALMKLGVPQVAIIEDSAATNTSENIIYPRKLLYEEGSAPARVILIHKPYMTRRFYATALNYWPEPRPELYVTSIESTFEDYMAYEDGAYGKFDHMIQSMLGDYERIVEYPDRGWMTYQEIPADVALAHSRLKEDGFTARPVPAI